MPKEDAETRRTRLKNLIKLGKDRGFLTYSEINDHLPDDLVDAEQIEAIISTFGDMGIQVYDQAPDQEQLLISPDQPAATPTDDDVEEQAEAALSTVDSEFGRTTDPVRMYMREMGSVELLTREGEIEIAKRIEDGLRHMIQAISACPTTVQEILDLADEGGKGRVAHRRGGRRPDRPEREGRPSTRRRPRPPTEEEEEEQIEEDEGASEEEENAAQTASLLKLKGEALEKFARIRRLFEKLKKALENKGSRDKDYLRVRDQIATELMTIRFTARTVERLCDSVRSLVEEIRSHERQIQDILVNKANMPRPHFIKIYAGAEGSKRWLTAELNAGHPWSEALVRLEPVGARAARQDPGRAAQDRHLDQGPEGHQQADVHGRGEGAPRQARDDRGQPAPGDLDREEVHQPRPAVPRPDPGRQHRPDEGGGQVRIPPRLQVLDLRHLVDPPGDHALDRRPGAHHPHPGAHDRDHQQDEPHLAPDPAGDGLRARSGDARAEDGDARGEDPQDPEDLQGADLDGDADRRRRRLAPRRLHRGPVDDGARGRGDLRVACATSPRKCSTRSRRARRRCCACASASR